MSDPNAAEVAPVNASAPAMVAAAKQSGVTPDGVTEFTLPSGKVAKMRPGTGRDLRNAGRVADMQKEGQLGLAMAIAAQKTTINGHALTYEDVLDLSDTDCLALIARSTEGKELSPPTISSS